MTDIGCEVARELIPLLAAQGLEASDRAGVEAHLADCGACRDEAELTALLFATRASPPEGLAESITSSIRFQRSGVRRPWWGLSAAAVAVLALGIGVVGSEEPAPPTIPAYAADAGQGGVWLSDDGFIAGAPSLDGLTDEDLEQLLEELASGGAA